MKLTKFVVIGQLVASGGLLAVFVLKSSGGPVPAAAAAVAAHAPKAPGEDAAAASAHDPAENADEGHAAAPAHPEKSGKPGGATARAAAGHGDKGHVHRAAPGLGKEPKAIARALLEGNGRFTSGEVSHPDLGQQRQASAEVQHPAVMVLGCADSRVPPELVFDRGIGELFVVRSAGNIAEPVAVGSLEYAAEHLHAKVLLVLGHEKCGAVQAALSESKMPSPNLAAMVDHISPATKGLKSWADGPDLVRMAVEANVRRQAEEILKRSPILRAAVAKGEITLLKAVYDLETGRVRPL